MQVGQSARTVLRLGCCVLVFAALVGIWETLASQAPGSPLSIGMLPAPIQRLRDSAFDFGVLLLLAGFLLGPRALPAPWRWTLYLGTLLNLASCFYAAANGMHGVQAVDLRPDATWLFAFKFFGRALMFACLLEIARRALWVAPQD